MVALTLHHYLTYYCSGENKINGDVKPLIKVKSHFVDSKFFEEYTAPKKLMSSMIFSTDKGSLMAIKDSYMVPRHDGVK